MKNTILIVVFLGFGGSLGALEQGLILEGVGIIGDQRYAFINYKNQPIRVAPQATVDDWLIERIEPRKIFVRSLKKVEGQENQENKLIEINMDSMGTAPPSPDSSKTPPHPSQAMPTNQHTPPPPVAAKPQPAFKPRVINDEDIPPGHRRVRTPFGDVLVKDDKK